MGAKMTIEFQKAIERKRLLRFTKGKKLVKKELEAAKDDLSEAENRYRNRKYKYATITGYYSMFHTARALIYSQEYREKSHYYLLVALQSLFVAKGLLDKSSVEDFHQAMILREEADYHGEFTKEGAQVTIESAKKFLQKARSIL
jgi:uncharacterized protein (UPF0332 family)